MCWFMDLTFQVPMQYCFIALDFTSIICHIHNSVLFLLWLHLFILSGVISPPFSSSILGTYRPEEFIFQCPIFCLFILFMGISGQEYWSGLPFPSPVDHVLSALPTMTQPSWVALHSMAHSFMELDKAEKPTKLQLKKETLLNGISESSHGYTLWTECCLPFQ